MNFDRDALRKRWSDIERGTKPTYDWLATIGWVAAHVPALVNENDRLLAVVETCRLEIEERKDRWADASVELDRLRARVKELDCRYVGDLAEVSGSHCPADAPCQRCRMEQTIARLEAEAAAWRPMETAPKDATRILVYRPGDQYTAVLTGKEATTQPPIQRIVFGAAGPWTHRQPLPPPPAGESEAKT